MGIVCDIKKDCGRERWWDKRCLEKVFRDISVWW